MAGLDELKSYLKTLNYPGMNIIRNEEVADIFGKKNRIYFLTWFIQKWDPDIVLPTDDQSKANTIAEFLCDNGFCTSQESTKFVEHSFELQPDKQLVIINRMLYNLSILSLSDETDPCDINYLEQMEILSKLDVNIFPSLGPIQVRTPQERLQKMEKVEQEIKELKKEIESMSNKYDSEIDLDSNREINWHASDLVKGEISTLVNNSIRILKDHKKSNSGTFDASFETVVSDCAKNISEVLKLCENKKAINEFVSSEMNNSEDEAGRVVADTIKTLFSLSQEVLRMD
ncbi:hypothetical protein AMK59_5880 [Oryctes borbonicus]|uniref:Uncharacterized protein n=1 Tax=Oryctes borbonicus TaxID=1629725 RepID=A0A0T6B066_9SCAR|nr:hypothetical protein AMK59_5880 [Oryctes borbonicus]